MGKQCCSTCSCHKNSHCHDCDSMHSFHSDKHCCQSECCCTCHCNRCRKDLCTTNFSVRLGGLQNGLSFRLRQLINCIVEFELDNGKKVKGTIVFVGTNFVELFVGDTLPTTFENEIGVLSEEQLDKESIKENNEEVSVLEDDATESKDIKSRIWIFSIDKISHMTVMSSCLLKKPCP